ncbi:hypothetical protein Tco_0954078 [Tanacetum coccineum]|uniref:Uncharacterized protein n=1 Tax=Tanacetum coccineum TaxID=301880 RepID=A0ABQ5E3A4_9ASTR
MAFSAISISSDSLEESVRTSIAQVILFGIIPTTIPSTTPTTDLPVIYDDTSLIPTDTPTIPTIPTIPFIALTIQYTSLFIDTDSSNSDIPERLPSQDPYEVTVARWRSRIAACSSPPPLPIHQILPAPPNLPRRSVVLVLPGQPNAVGQPYRTQPNGERKMLTARKRVGSLPTHRLASRYPSDPSSLDSHSDTSFDSSSRHSSSSHSISDSPCDSPTATSARPSRKRCRSPTASVYVASPVRRTLSPVRADLLPPHKRIKDFDFVTNLEVSSEEGYVSYVPREVGLGVDVEDSYEPYTEPGVDFVIQADIDACIAFVDDIRARGTHVRVMVKTAAEEEVESSSRGTVEVEVGPRVGPVIDDDVRESVREDVPDHVTADGAVDVTNKTLGDLVQRFHDHTMEIPAHPIQLIESVQRFQGHKIARVDLEVTAMTERIVTLERDNMRLRGMLGVKRQIVDRLQHSMSRVQKDLRQIRRFRFYDCVRLG